MPGIKIELSIKDAELFKLFRKYQDDIEQMVKANVFDFANGCCFIYRDSNKILKDIEIKEKTFTRKKELLDLDRGVGLKVK